MSKSHDWIIDHLEVNYYHGIRKDDYGEDIDNWYDAYKKYSDDIRLKEMKNLDYKKIKERMTHRYDDRGRIHISPRNRIYDLSIYYDNPDEYYFDIINIIKSLKNVMYSKEDYTQFIYTDGSSTRISTLHFMFNMIMWYPLFNLGINITPDELFCPKLFTNKSFTAYINDKILEKYKHLTTFNQMSKILSRMYDLFVCITEKASIYLGLSFSLYDVYKRWDDNDEIKKINHTKIPRTMSIPEAESMMDDQAKRFEVIMREEERDSQLRPFLESGKVNRKQLREFFVNIGFKPDLEGRTLNTCPQSNFITDGLRDPVDYVTDASGGRKATNLSLQIDEGGYFQRTLCKSAADLKLMDDLNYDCQSKHYYRFTIKNNEDLANMNGRWFVEENHLKQITGKDFEYIGKTLDFRSPTTCACKNGRICAICYGFLASQNRGINIGINSGLVLSEKLYQNMMSAKKLGYLKRNF